MLTTFYKYISADRAKTKKVGARISPSYSDRVTQRGGVLGRTEELLEEYRPSDKPSRYDSIFVGQDPTAWERTMGRQSAGKSPPALALVSPLPGAALAVLDARFYDKVVKALKRGDQEAARKAAEDYWTTPATGPQAGDEAIPEVLLESGGTFEGLVEGHKPKPDSYFLNQLGPAWLDTSPKAPESTTLSDRILALHGDVKKFRDAAIAKAGGDRPPDWEYVSDRRVEVREHQSGEKSLFTMVLERPNARLELRGRVVGDKARLSLNYFDLWQPNRSGSAKLTEDGLSCDHAGSWSGMSEALADFRLGKEAGTEVLELVQGVLDPFREGAETPA